MTDYCNLDYVSNVVDDFVSETNSARTSPNEFWEKIHSNYRAQQIYAQCLIFKYISYTYGLGHKPLREAIRVIKNVTFTGPNEKKTVEISSSNSTPTKSTTPRRQSLVLGVSPVKRQRSLNLLDRRASAGDHKNSSGRNTAAESNGKPLESTRRKTSDGLAELSLVLQEEINVMKTLRDLMYTLSFMLHTCSIGRWDFSHLREVFLLWNKARGWEQDPTGFESLVMKNFSRPPDEQSDEEKWKLLFSDILSSHVISEKDKYNTLDDKKVGNSVKYWALLYKIKQSSGNIKQIMDALAEIAAKLHDNTDESKVLPLLHIVCDVIITAPYVPVASLEKMYASIQMFYLWAKPISSAVKEVLDLIQTEMKSPGYYCRIIYSQEHDLHEASQDTDIPIANNPVNILVDTRLSRCRSLTGAFKTITSVQDKSELNRIRYQRLLIEHIFQAVFGPDGCDLSSLQLALESCSESTLKTVYAEALSAMEHSLGLGNHSHANEYARQQLEALSNQLTDETEGVGSSQEMDGQDVDQGDDSLRSNSSSGSLQSVGGSMKQTSRNQPPITRTVSNASLIKMPSLESQGDFDGSYAADSMRHASIKTEHYDQRQLSDTLFQLVRSAAKEFLVEKRKSSSFTVARQRYLRHCSVRRRISDPRDSGVIEDYAEAHDAQASKPHQASNLAEPKNLSAKKSPNKATLKRPKLDMKDSEKEWLNSFLEHGFDMNDCEIDNLLNQMTLDTPPTSEGPGPDFLNLSAPNHEDAGPTDHSEGPLMKDQDQAVTEALAGFSFTVEELDGEMKEEDDHPPKSKSSKKKSKSSKSKFKTIKLAKKLVRGAVKRSSSSRVTEDPPRTEKEETTKDLRDDVGYNFQEEDLKIDRLSISSGSSTTPPSAAMSFFGAVTASRFRTLSDPLKTRKSRRRSKYTHVGDIFQSQSDVSQRNSFSSTYLASYQECEHGRAGLSLSVSDNIPTSPQSPDSGRLDMTPKRKSFPRDARLSVGNEARNRMDSGVVLDKQRERPRYQKMTSVPHGADWEGAGVAGVKIFKKLAVKKTRQSRSSFSSLGLGRALRKKVMKLVFVGNDRTISEVARAYYELRRKQMTRAPLLNHIDLRIFYIPVGDSAFEDERPPSTGEMTKFDLQIGKMLGRLDPWYLKSVGLTFNNLLRVIPKMSDDDYELDQDRANILVSSVGPESIIADSLTNYTRFAVTTQSVPLYKATMRKSTDETISEVFCCSVEIGSVAYKQAIKEGRFGKLVDLSSDSGPPEIYTTFEYVKFGLNGFFKSSMKLDETFYRSVSVLPIALAKDDTRDQMLYTGSDSMHVTLIENDKAVKSMKRGLRKGLSEDEGVEVPKTKFLVSAAKLEVVRPQQGTFTVWLDQSLIYTNIKSIEVSRCWAPDYERNIAPKRRHTRAPPRFLSLPVKTFWPSSHSC